MISYLQFQNWILGLEELELGVGLLALLGLQSNQSSIGPICVGTALPTWHRTPILVPFFCLFVLLVLYVFWSALILRSIRTTSPLFSPPHATNNQKHPLAAWSIIICFEFSCSMGERTGTCTQSFRDVGLSCDAVMCLPRMPAIVT